MKIGMIGSGSFGAALARRFTKAGHTVTIANSRGPESLTELAQEIKATPVSLLDVVKDVDLLVVAIPMKNILTCPRMFWIACRRARSSWTNI
jgi:8-hydroxy-5-deazaflavin:NADPH oxidoreductase